MKEPLITILKKQCEIVGADFDKVNFDDELWFFSHQWDKEQEKQFIDWLTDYLHSNRNIMKQLYNISSGDKKFCRKAAEKFAFNYGWKYKEE
jgi:hypothetical protein